MNAEGRVSSYRGLPEAEMVEEIAKNYSRVTLRIARRNPKGHLAGVTSIVVESPELMQLEQKIRELAGGGTYRVDIYDPTNPLKRAGTPLEFDIEGPPKALVSAEAAQQAYAGIPPFTPYGATAGSPPQAPWGGVLPQGPQPGPMAWPPAYMGPPFMQPPGPPHEPMPAPGASIPSDAMALRLMEDLKAEITVIKKERDDALAAKEKDRKEAETRQGKLEGQINDLRLEIVEQRRVSEMKAMEARMEAFMRAPKEKDQSVKDWAPLATALAPIALALLQGPRESQQAMTQQLVALATKPSPPPPPAPDPTALLGAIMPLLVKQVDMQSPSHQLEALQASTDSQLALFGMMSQIMQASQANLGPENPWSQMLQHLLAAGGEMVGKFMDRRVTPQPPMLPPYRMQQLPAQQQPQAPEQPAYEAPGATYSTVEAEGTESEDEQQEEQQEEQEHDEEVAQAQPTTAPIVTPPPAPAQPQAPTGPTRIAHTNGTSVTGKELLAEAKRITDEFTINPGIPAAFKTQPWRDLIYRIHAQLDVKSVAMLFVKLLETGRKGGSLGPLADIYSSIEAAETTITNLIGSFPIVSQNPTYATQLRDLVVDEVNRLLPKQVTAQAS